MYLREQLQKGKLCNNANVNLFQDAEVIERVEHLLTYSYQTRPFNQLTVSSSSDQENNNSDDVTVINIVAKAKRALSSSYNSCEPIPKKLRYDVYPEMESDEKEDTSSGLTYSQD